MTDTSQCRNQTTVNQSNIDKRSHQKENSRSLQSNEPLPKKVSTKDNGAMKESLMEDTQRKGFVQAALDKSKKDIPTFDHRMSISGISYLIERLSYEQYLAVNEIGFGGFWAIRTNIIPKSLGMWLLENYDYCGSFLNLSNHRILEFTKEDVHATLGLPMGPKKRRRWGISSGAPKIGKMRDGILDRGDHGNEFKRDFVIYVEHVNWVIHKHGQLHLSKAINKLITIPVEGSSVSIPGVGMCADHGNIGGLMQDEDVGWGPSTLEALMNVEAAAIEQFQKKKDCRAPSFSLGLTQEIGHFDDVMWLHTIMNLKVAIEFKLIILHMQKGRLLEQYLRLLHPIHCARILMHPINKLQMTVSETAKKFFQQEQQSRKAT
ncbi:LOW QUALITY PROTEIN: hypothetical protein Cgig2_017990 [Carnegiea gigantea]|uniref:Uncharacterized protein n=1 Tax=Carnegiea gigantea TaxID=171969 RepID=A0A9Q1JS50_9CARY|nr:LOW QUALITY PROTEIN: hypothetical protein Cgig2_017990 [Carnegiea gigantea]